MPANLVRNFSKHYTSHNSLQNYRRAKKLKLTWLICARRAAGKILFSGATARMKLFAIGVSLQGYCLEWELKFRQARNTENTMNYIEDIFDMAWERHLQNRGAKKLL